VSPRAELGSRTVLSDFIEWVSARYGNRASSDLSNREASEIREPSRKLTGRDRTAPHRKITGRRASEFRGSRNRLISSLLLGPSLENHLSNTPRKGRKVTGVRGPRHFDPCDSAKGRVRPPESHRYVHFWRLFCNPARLYGGEKPVTFRCCISRTGDFPMLSCAEPVILPRDSDENR
jgi:hypothetical protein